MPAPAAAGKPAAAARARASPPRSLPRPGRPADRAPSSNANGPTGPPQPRASPRRPSSTSEATGSSLMEQSGEPEGGTRPGLVAEGRSLAVDCYRNYYLHGLTATRSGARPRGYQEPPVIGRRAPLRVVANQREMIVGYHVIFSAYGFWLPNDPRGSWSDFVGSWE